MYGVLVPTRWGGFVASSDLGENPRTSSRIPLPGQLNSVSGVAFGPTGEGKLAPQVVPSAYRIGVFATARDASTRSRKAQVPRAVAKT